MNFEGRFYKSRGPLNTIPSPQGSPVVCQAGGSPAGLDLAARHADTVVASVPGIAAMKEYRADNNRQDPSQPTIRPEKDPSARGES